MSTKLLASLRNIPHASRAFAAGAFLFHRNDAVETLHVARAGTIRLLRYQTDGQTAVLQRAAAGDILAEASVFSPSYHCDGIAMTDAYAVTDIQRLLDTDIRFCRAWASAMSHQLQAARRRAELVSLRTVAERLNAWLTWHEGEMPVKGDWKGVAEEIGVSPEAFYRELATRRRR